MCLRRDIGTRSLGLVQLGQSFNRGSALLFSEDGEVYVSLGIRLEVGDEAVGTLDGVVQVIVECGVVHHPAQCAVGILCLCQQLVQATHCGVHAVEGGLQL